MSGVWGLENWGYVVTNELWVILITSITSFVVAYFTYWLTGKSRLIVFSPQSTNFVIPPMNENEQTLYFRAGQVIIQNSGRTSATNVQIYAENAFQPVGYSLVPNIDHEIKNGPEGQWMMEIPFLGPGETLNLQILNGPNIATIRSREGIAKLVDVFHQRVFPPWFNYLATALMLVGLITIAYGIYMIILSLTPF